MILHQKKQASDIAVFLLGKAENKASLSYFLGDTSEMQGESQ